VDLVVAATSPPFVGLAVAGASRRRGLPHAHWTMDVYPDVLEAHWAGGGAAWVRRLLASAARFQFRGAVLVLTLGPFMNERVARYASSGRTRPVPLWTDLHAHAVASPSAWRERRGWHEDDLVLLYSGNMGRGHRMEEFLEAARRLGPHGPVWAFVGGGPRRHEVDRFRVEHADARIELLPAVAPDEVAASLLAGDVHLVSMATRWQGLIVPSKLAAAFALGRPAIFVGGRENEIAACIAESGGGWRVDEGDVDALVRAVGEARQPEERARRGKAAQEYARVHFDRVRNVARVADLLEQAASGPLP
jgi:glycosyltransferase involved in cell wall biosynthesis